MASKHRLLKKCHGFQSRFAVHVDAETLQNRDRNFTKSTLKKALFLKSIFKGLKPCFGEVFEGFFKGQINEHSKNMTLAKTSKLVILPR